jgi:hypothetical protein
VKSRRLSRTRVRLSVGKERSLLMSTARPNFSQRLSRGGRCCVRCRMASWRRSRRISTSLSRCDWNRSVPRSINQESRVASTKKTIFPPAVSESVLRIAGPMAR